MSAIKQLIEFGQSPWYDNLTRSLATGGLRGLIDEHGIRGVTSNPTIFEKAMASGTDYDAQLREVSAAGASTEAAYWDLVTTDIAHATDIFRPHYEEWEGRDGKQQECALGSQETHRINLSHVEFRRKSWAIYASM